MPFGPAGGPPGRGVDDALAVGCGPLGATVDAGGCGFPFMVEMRDLRRAAAHDRGAEVAQL